MLLRTALLSCCLISSANANSFNSSVAVGTDYWKINSPAKTSARYLPDYSLPVGKEFSDLSHWVDVDLSYETALPVGYLKFTADAAASSLIGQKINRADIDYRIGNQGARVGILPYRISWCRDNAESAFISEPDVFCRFHGLNEVAQGSFGLQTYSSNLVGNWLLDSMLGYYQPMIASQRDALGPYVSVGPTVKHDAHGLSVNALHLPSSLQLRFGWLNTKQHQDDSSGGTQRQMHYDSYYVAAEITALPKLTTRLSSSGYIGDQTNGSNPYKWNGNSSTIDAIYKLNHKHSIAVGYSRYSNKTFYPMQTVNKQLVVVKGSSIAYSYQASPDWRLMLQYTDTTDWASTRLGVITYRKGNAVGARATRSF